MNRRSVLFLLFALCFSQSLSFVVRPHQASATVQQLYSTHLNRNNPTKKKNVLTKASDKISSWLRPLFQESRLHHVNKHTVDLLQKRKADDDDDADNWLGFPFGASLEKVVNRELSQEKRKAKPLLHQAQALIQKDADVVQALGLPIVIGSMVSQQKSTTVVNSNKSQQIWDSFQVAGPRDRGVATIVADSYAKGHLKSLRVTIGGIKYDIDV